MSSKEISVFIIGIMLVGFLYVMRNPISTTTNTIIPSTNKTVGIDVYTEKHSNFDPSTTNPTVENILDIPAWTFDFATIEALTSDELVKSIDLAIQEERFFSQKITTPFSF